MLFIVIFDFWEKIYMAALIYSLSTPVTSEEDFNLLWFPDCFNCILSSSLSYGYISVGNKLFGKEENILKRYLWTPIFKREGWSLGDSVKRCL